MGVIERGLSLFDVAFLRLGNTIDYNIIIKAETHPATPRKRIKEY